MTQKRAKQASSWSPGSDTLSKQTNKKKKTNNLTNDTELENTSSAPPLSKASSVTHIHHHDNLGPLTAETCSAATGRHFAPTLILSHNMGFTNVSDHSSHLLISSSNDTYHPSTLVVENASTMPTLTIATTTTTPTPSNHNVSMTPSKKKNPTSLKNQPSKPIYPRAIMLGYEGTLIEGKFLPDPPQGCKMYPPKTSAAIEKASNEEMEKYMQWLNILKMFVGKKRACNIETLQAKMKRDDMFFSNTQNRKEMCGLINNSVNNLKKTSEGREKDRQRSKERRNKFSKEGRCTDCGELLEKDGNLVSGSNSCRDYGNNSNHKSDNTRNLHCSSGSDNTINLQELNEMADDGDDYTNEQYQLTQADLLYLGEDDRAFVESSLGLNDVINNSVTLQASASSSSSHFDDANSNPVQVNNMMCEEPAMIDFSQFDAATLFDNEGKVRLRCKKCLQRHASYKLKTYTELRQEGKLCPRHVSVTLEECENSKGACFKCGIVHMTQLYSSLKCFEQNVQVKNPLFECKDEVGCLPECQLCGTVVENLFQAVGACLYHLNFHYNGKTTRTFPASKYFASAFNNQKDPTWFKIREPLAILCKACHDLLHAIALIEKRGHVSEEESSLNQWVQIHIEMVRKLGAKCAQCLLDFEQLGTDFFSLAHVHHVGMNGADQRMAATEILKSENRAVVSKHVNEYTLALEGKTPLDQYQLLCSGCHQMVHMDKHARLVLSRSEHEEDKKKVKMMHNLRARFHLVSLIKQKFLNNNNK